MRKHAKFLIVPILIATVYTVGILLTPFQQYKAWLYNDSLFTDSPYIQFLGIMRKIVKLTFVALLLITYILNRGLLRKYAHKAEQYYSDMQDAKSNNAEMLNYFLIIISLSSLIAHIIGRKLLLPNEIIIDIIWLIFAVALYGIGYMGFKHKAINPTFDLDEAEAEDNLSGRELNLSQQLILDKLLVEFEKNKIYLNPGLNINDVVQRVGTNRTYISSIINQQFNLNFCSFVNNFRLEELQQIVIKTPSISNEILAEKCGFGSFNSMKRAIASRTGYSLNEWKRSVLNDVNL